MKKTAKQKGLELALLIIVVMAAINVLYVLAGG